MTVGIVTGSQKKEKRKEKEKNTYQTCTAKLIYLF